MKHNKLLLGIVLILISSILSCLGQLLWKLAANGSTFLLLGGLMLYGMGACCMMVSFRFGELSVLHPMLSIGYVLSLIPGSLVLGENISLTKIFGIAIIMTGMFFLGHSAKEER